MLWWVRQRLPLPTPPGRCVLLPTGAFWPLSHLLASLWAVPLESELSRGYCTSAVRTVQQ